MLPKDLKDLLLAFNDQHVRYLIVGGYAFGAPFALRSKVVFPLRFIYLLSLHLG
jgi:hypothetical protein